MSNAVILESPSARGQPRTAARFAHSKVVLAGILLLLGCSYMFNGMDRMVFPALMEPIRAEYGLSLPQGGFINTSFAVMIAVFGGTAGWCMARFGRRATLVGGLISYSIFTFLTPFAVSFFDLAFYRAMTGAGEALHIGSIFAILGAYFGAHRGTAIGIVNSFFGIGSFLGPFFGSRIFAWTGVWGLPFYAYGIAGITAALLVLFLVPKDFCCAVDPETASTSAPAVSTEGFLNRNIILCAAAFFLVGYSFFAFSALYTSYLKTELGYSIVEAGTVFSAYGLGALCAVFCGWLGEKLKQVGMIAMIAGQAAVTYALFHGATGQVAHAFLCFAFGAICSGYLYPRFVAVFQRSVKPEHIGYAMGLAIPVFYIPGLFAGYLFGVAVLALGWPIAAAICVTVPAAADTWGVVTKVPYHATCSGAVTTSRTSR